MALPTPENYLDGFRFQIEIAGLPPVGFKKVTIAPPGKIVAETTVEAPGFGEWIRHRPRQRRLLRNDGSYYNYRA